MRQDGTRLMCKANVGSCNVYKYGEQFKFGMYLEDAERELEDAKEKE